MDYDLQQRLDAFVSGECSLGVFLEELFGLCDARPESAWEVLSLIDQYYRREKLSADLFRTIKNRIEQRVLGVPDSDTIHELPESPRATEPRVGPARGGPLAMVATHERTASPGELASKVRARRSELPGARRSVHRLPKRRAVLADFGRRTRTALANTQRRLDVWAAKSGTIVDDRRPLSGVAPCVSTSSPLALYSVYWPRSCSVSIQRRYLKTYRKNTG